MNCYSCGYCRKEKRDNKEFNEVYYCNDLDCIVDPTDPSCRY